MSGAVAKQHTCDRVAGARRSRARYLVLSLLFVATAVNFADRSMLSITGSAVSKDLRLTPLALGFIFSAFGWAYAAGQVPGGWLLDRFGSRKIYALSVFSWSAFVLLQAFVGFCSAAAVYVLFALVFLMGLCEAPVLPANSRIVAAWFPAAERGTAAAIFGSAQYFAAVLFAPLMGWITQVLGWKYVFIFMGGVGFVVAGLCLKSIHNPREHPKISFAELDFIQQGGALIDMDRRNKGGENTLRSRSILKILLGNRMLLGVYLGTYGVTAVMYFFLTWFPIYLQARGMSILQIGAVIALPALCGFSGGISGGLLSDYLLRNGRSLTFARKAPIVLGMMLVLGVIVRNYVNAPWVIVFIMALAYFGKGFGSLGWAVIADTAPKQIAGLTAGVFNTFANIAAITTPIVIGYIVQVTGNYKGAMIFLAANALTVIFSYLVIVGQIKRLELPWVFS